jgi:diguanylate cyclase (GGDEF)-like protein
MSEENHGMPDDPHRQLNGDEAAELKEAVDQSLNARLRDLRLPPEILALFKSRTSRRTRGMMASWCLWVAAIDFVLGVLDFSVLQMPGLIFVLATRALMITTFTASSLLLRRNKLVGREHLAIIPPCLLGILCAGLAEPFAQSAILEIDYLVTAVLMVATAIILLSMDLAHEKILTVTAMAGISLFTLMISPASLAIRLQLLCLFNGVLVALFEARKVMILYEHRLFLLTLRDEIASAETANINAQLSSIAYIDQLTDIPNRRYFDEICASMSETTKNLLPLSICMIDIDRFKRLNDHLGHLQGDHCLRVIASTIRYNLRGKTDVLVRYGGEEFVLLLPGTDIDRAADIAERVRAAIAGLRHPNPGSEYGIITASIGIAMVNAHPVKIEAMIEQADNALYRAKTAGRNRVSV